MALNRDQIHLMLKEICVTCPDEMSCEVCLDELTRLVDRLADGASPCETLRAVEQHLDVCPECREEFEALRVAIQAFADAYRCDDR